MTETKAELDTGLVVEVDAVASLVIAATSRAEDVAASLARSLAQIAEISRTVRNLASQTDLLALNAAIEAARSGDAGAGFGVVAREVKELARRSSTCADTIDHLVVKAMKSLTLNNAVVCDLNIAVQRGMAVVTRMTDAANVPSSFADAAMLPDLRHQPDEGARLLPDLRT